jgi:hypothetical protein
MRNNAAEAERKIPLDASKTSFKEPFVINAKVGFTKTS